MDTNKQTRTVVHLELNGKHYYYGNLKALCDSWDKDEIECRITICEITALMTTIPIWVRNV